MERKSSRRNFLKTGGCLAIGFGAAACCPISAAIIFDLANPRPVKYQEMLDDPRAHGFNKATMIETIKETYKNQANWPDSLTVFRNGDNTINYYYFTNPSPATNRISSIEDLLVDLSHDPQRITGLYIEAGTQISNYETNTICKAIQRMAVNFDENGQIFGNEFLDNEPVIMGGCRDLPPSLPKQLRDIINDLKNRINP